MCLGQGVVHQGAGHELAIFVVDQFFPHGLAQALGNAAVDLSVHQQRVDDVTAIVDGNVLVDLYFTGFSVHFNRANVTAEGESEVGGLEEVSGFHAGLKAGGNVAGGVGGHHEFAERNGFFAALRVQAAAADGDVGGFRAEQVSGESGHLGFEFLGGHISSGAADGGSTTAKSTNPVGHGHGVAVDNVDVIRINAQFVSNELGERGFFPLAVRRCAGEQRDFAGGFDAHGAALPASGRRSG